MQIFLLMQSLTRISIQFDICPANDHNYPVTDVPTNIPTYSRTGEGGFLLMLDYARNCAGRQTTLWVDREQVGGRHALMELVTARFHKLIFFQYVHYVRMKELFLPKEMFLLMLTLVLIIIT